jgi:hypothetical protein
MNWVSNFGVNGSSFIDGITNDVHDSTQSLRSDWNTNWSTSVNNFLTSNETFS